MQSKPICFSTDAWNGSQAEPLVGCAGTRGVRTRAIIASNDGKVEWVERLILELKGPKGTPPLHS